MTKISVTGHRKLLNDVEVRRDITLSLKNYKETYTDLSAVSALAAGADTIFIEEALKLNIPVSFLLPFPLEEYLKDFDEKQQEKLQKLIRDNDNKYEIETDREITNQQERNEAYLAVGRKLVDDTDILLAVWDGQPALGMGGTGDVVDYAISKGKIINIIKALRP